LGSDFPQGPRLATDPAYLIYTSGTTGLPKGVVIPHAGIVNLIRSDRDFFDLGPTDRVAQGSSHAYDSSVEEIWMAWSAGATVVVMDDDANRLGPDLADWLRSERITVACPPPTLLRTMGDTAAKRLPDLRLLYVGGEALTRDVVDIWAPGRLLVNGYGPTECSVTSLRTRVDVGDDITIGFPVDGLSAWVVDDALALVEVGGVGELVIGGPGLAIGYRNDPVATAAKFVDHPILGRVYRTGDAARLRADGRFECLGRIDAQVKLRGFRIELEAIEAALASLPGVREAACVVTGEPGREEIAAWMVAVDPQANPDFAEIRSRVSACLPPYMVPARYGWLDALPRSTGGKVLRSGLPTTGAVPAGGAKERVGPVDALEGILVNAASAVLGMDAGSISTDADFFVDLGGTSLIAARWVSKLREDERASGATVRLVYEARTIRDMAHVLRRENQPLSGPVQAVSARVGNPLAVSVLQGIWLLLEWVMEVSVAGAWVVGPVVSALQGDRGAVAWPVLLLLTFLGLPGAWVVSRIVGAVLLKWIVVGRWLPGAVPVWTGSGLRQWLVVHAVRRIPWGVLEATEGASWVLRWLGATVGRGVHWHRGSIPVDGGWDLLTVGDNAVLCQDAALCPVELADGCRVAAPVVVGDGAVVGIRATVCGGASLGAGAVLGPLSALGAGTATGDFEYWDGVPATRSGPAEPMPPSPGNAWGVLAWGVANATAAAVVGLLLSLPGGLVLGLLVAPRLFAGGGWVSWLLSDGSQVGPGLAALAAVLSLPPTLIGMGLLARSIGAVSPGRYPLRGWVALRVRLVAELVDSASRWLSGSLFWPFWLRLAGMRVGPNCEISTLVGLFPRSVSMERDVFCADGIYLGCPAIRGGWLEIGDVSIGRDSFFGNHAVVPPGTTLPSDILLGVCTVADADRIRQGSSWFGLPSFELPRREVVDADRSLTHSPGPLRFATRLFWETLRLLVPALPAWLWSSWLAIVVVAGWSSWGGALPAALAIGVVLPWVPAGAVLLLKWLLLGRVRPGTHPLWSCWCSRWDFLYVAWGMWASVPLGFLEGTLLLVGYLRAIGCRIGRRALLGHGFAHVVDPDMLRFGDDVTVDALFQAHTFEDRVLKIDYVDLRDGCTIGPNTVILYGADVGARARVAPHSVVMKREVLLADTMYEGAPTQPV